MKFVCTIDKHGSYTGWASEADYLRNPALFEGDVGIPFHVDVENPMYPTEEEWKAVCDESELTYQRTSFTKG